MSRVMTPQKHRYDDLPAIVENPQIRRLWPVWEVLSTPAETTVDGRPIVSLTLAINYALGGLNVWGYHVVNLMPFPKRLYRFCSNRRFQPQRTVHSTP